jgi:ligand-binding SRPBCC domain-containing protein
VLYSKRAGGDVPPVPVFEHRFEVKAPLAAVRAFHADSSALRKLTPPPTVIQLHRFGPLEDGMVAEFTLWLGPVPVRWKARHEDVGPSGFVDVQVEGPMAAWRHTHRFEPLAADRTEVRDRVEYEHPGGLRGLGTRLLFSRVALRGLFSYRALATRRGARALASG